NDLCLMVFTGSIPLPHLFAAPAVTLLAALDNDGTERPLTHYQDVYQRRSRTDTANFEFLRDRELMPENSHFNVIRDMAEHPDSQRYTARPLTKQDTDTFYQDVENAIALHEENQKQYFALPPEQETAVPVSENRDFISLSFANTTLQGKTFKHCHFNQCDFSESQLTQCSFEHCRFTSCLFAGAVITGSQLTGGRFQLSNLSGSTFTGTGWENLTLDDCLLEKTV
ncbi:pentapeptide repeat-containing protein, partial [Klebsiella variicola]|uniref:pentapeptide repeat-containing protein n=1 Tax=Klebsiella variicola TaxID=244366 RepID=UPI002B053961